MHANLPLTVRGRMMLVKRWPQLPAMVPESLRRDIDAVIDPSL